MTVIRTGRVFADQFAGEKNLADGNLAQHVRNLAIDRARARVVTLAIAALTDSSGGSAGASNKDATLPVAADTSSAGGFTPASLNAALVTYENAYAVLSERANLMRSPIGMGTAPLGDGTIALSGTVAACTATVTGGTGNASASIATTLVALNQVLDRQATTLANIDEVRRAVGLANTARESTSTTKQGHSNDSLLLPSITDAAVVVAGTSATTGVLKSVVDTLLGKLCDNVALMAAQLTAASAVTVAGQSIGVYAS